MAKTAKIYVVTIDVYCPHCEQAMEDPDSGSLNWDVNSTPFGEEVQCSNCGEGVLLPKQPKSVRMIIQR